jgi:hypothetical protein
MTARKTDLTQLTTRQLEGRTMNAYTKLAEFRAEHRRREELKRGPGVRPELLKTFYATVTALIPIEIRALDEEDAEQRIREVECEDGLGGLEAIAFDSAMIEVESIEEEVKEEAAAQ